MRPRRVVFDADGLIALHDPGHDFHRVARNLFWKLGEYRVEFIFPITAICEAITVFQRRPDPDQAEFVAKKFAAHPQWLLIPDKAIFLESFKEYVARKAFFSVGNTPFDATVATIARNCHADAIFSFDHYYKVEGLILVKDLRLD